MLFRSLEWQGHTLAYLSDVQQPMEGMAVDDATHTLADGVDLLIHDSQFTAEEFSLKSTWGHCTMDYALAVAEQCGVKQVALSHHDPSRSDAALDAMLGFVASSAQSGGFEAVIAAEGMRVTVGQQG